MRKLSLAMMGIATAALMTMVSCRKPVNGLVTPGEARTVTFTATTESNDGSKTAVSDHDILWKEGDKISVNGEEMTLASGAGSKSGTFTGTITTAEEYYIGYPAATTTYTSPNTLKLGIPSSWTYDANNVVVPMAAYTKEEGNIQFNNAVNVLKLNLNGNNTNASKLKSIVLSHASAKLNGDITVEFDGEKKPTFREAEGTNATKTTTVNFGDGLQLTSETTSIYIVLPKINESSDKASDNDIKVTFNCANGGRIEKTIPYNPKFSDVNQLIHNDGNVLTVNATTLPGEFTVGSDSKGEPKTIKFSCGNLYWDGSSWKLEDNQWKFSSEWNENHISHFWWGRDGEEARKYGDDCLSDLTTEDKFFTEVSGFTVEGQTGWRTLKSAEWVYLVSERDNASDLRGFKTIEGVYGLVLLPDGTDVSETPVSGITSAANLIAANAVFLPAAGLCGPYGMEDQQLHYWSSTPDVEEQNNAMRLYGEVDDEELVINSEQRARGLCIRLVK